MLNNAILEGLRPGQKFKKKNLLGKLVRKDSRKGGSENVQDFYDFHVNEDTTLGTLPSLRKPELLTLLSFGIIPYITCTYQTYMGNDQKILGRSGVQFE